jgi:hypothetical protein
VTFSCVCLCNCAFTTLRPLLTSLTSLLFLSFIVLGASLFAPRRRSDPHVAPRPTQPLHGEKLPGGGATNIAHVCDLGGSTLNRGDKKRTNLTPVIAYQHHLTASLPAIAGKYCPCLTVTPQRLVPTEPSSSALL